MIKSAKLKCFRQHLDRLFEFSPGLVVIRAPNEGGKTTLIEAIGYCLFGTKALRESIDDVVSWGHEPKELKVVIKLVINNTTYTISRGKSGAQVKKGSKKAVTGQNECTMYVERLLGIPKGNAFQLLIANQNDIRGVLTKGNVALTGLIEQLADFQQLDTIIDLIQKHLPTGNTSAATDRVTRAATHLEFLQNDLVVVDQDAHAIETADLSEKVKDLRVASSHEKYRQASSALQNAEGIVSQRMNLQKTASQLEVDARRLQKQRREFESVAAPDPKMLEKMQKELKSMANQEDTLAYYQSYQKLRTPDIYWEGDLPSFIVASQVADSEAYEAGQNVSQLQAQIDQVSRTRIGGTHCPTCKRRMDNADEVEALNLEIADKLEGLEGEKEAAQKVWDLAREEASVYRVIGSHQGDVDHFVVRPDFVDVDESMVPFKIVWTAPLPQPVNQADMEKLRTTLEASQKQANNAQDAASKLSLINESVESTAFRLQEAQAELLKLPELNMAELRAKLDKTKTAYLNVSEKAEALTEELFKLETDMKVRLAKQEEQQKSIGAATIAAQHAGDDLTSLLFNNNLLKDVRSARPLIADQLWKLTLSAVSSYFTNMRAQPSLITKDGEGFKVNGKKIAGLSGSTLDILGLAVRFGLMKTFLPEAPMVLLDEPSGACDTDRTVSVSGLLLSSGFQQTVLVTHKDIDEGAASQLLEM